MSKQRIQFESIEWDRRHQEKRIRKLQKIETLKALLEMWETHPNVDHNYLLELRRKIRSAETQYSAMKI